MLKGHKLPEPLYFAHRYGNKIKDKLSVGKDNNKVNADVNTCVSNNSEKGCLANDNNPKVNLTKPVSNQANH